LATGCRLWPEDLHLGVDNKPNGSAIFIHLTQANKAYIMEAQLNGWSIVDKVDFARNHFEKEVSVGAVFVIHSRVACIGAWQLSRTQFTVPRAGQKATITELRIRRRSTEWELDTP